MTDKQELRRLCENAAITHKTFAENAEAGSSYQDVSGPEVVIAILDELEACKLLLQECDKVIQEDGGVYIELRAFLGGKLPASEVIALLGPDGKDG